jgi:Uma2 family endonuclease
MATSTAVPVEEYLSTTYHPDREYVDGQLLERNVGEIVRSRTQTLIVLTLGPRERDCSFRTYTEQRVRVSDKPRYRIPDVCVKGLPYKRTPVLERPDLAIEIVAPCDEPADLLDKIADYVAAGIPHIWVIDPYKRTLMEVVNGVIHRPSTTALATPLVGEVDFASIFQELDEPTE